VFHGCFVGVSGCGVCVFLCGHVAEWVFNSMSPAPTSLRGCDASRSDGSRHR